MDQATREGLNQYVRDLFAPEDEQLKSIRAETDSHGMPQIEIMPEDGRMLQFLLRAVGAKQVIEVGTLGGYSGLWLVRALPDDGKLITIEYSEDHAEVARASFERAGVADRVEIRLGDGREVLPTLSSDGPYDGIFIDANKDGYPAYLDWAIENIRSGGLIMAHNAFFHGQVLHDAPERPEIVNGVKTFNKRLAEDPRLFGTIIPIGDGIAAAIVR